MLLVNVPYCLGICKNPYLFSADAILFLIMNYMQNPSIFSYTGLPRMLMHTDTRILSREASRVDTLWFKTATFWFISRSMCYRFYVLQLRTFVCCNCSNRSKVWIQLTFSLSLLGSVQVLLWGGPGVLEFRLSVWAALQRSTFLPQSQDVLWRLWWWDELSVCLFCFA